jgi:hypothetical protein
MHAAKPECPRHLIYATVDPFSRFPPLFPYNKSRG